MDQFLPFSDKQSSNLIFMYEIGGRTDMESTEGNVTESAVSAGPSLLLGLNESDYMWVYCGIIGALLLLSLVRYLMLWFLCLQSSTVLHNNLFAAVMRAPMKFFQDNSSGETLLYSYRIHVLHCKWYHVYSTPTTQLGHKLTPRQFNSKCTESPMLSSRLNTNAKSMLINIAKSHVIQ